MGQKPKETRLTSTDVYLYVLLRRMIEFEVTNSIVSEPTIKEVNDFIEKNYPDDDFVERKFIAEFFRKKLLKEKPKYVGLRELNWMVKLITKLGKFESWEHFQSIYKYATHSIKVEYLSDDYDYEQVRQNTHMQITSLYYARLQEGHIPDISPIKTHILVNQLEYSDLIVDYQILKISKSFIPLFFDFYSKLVLSPYNSLEDLQSWYEINPNIFYCCVNNQHLASVANITLLPIKEDVIEKLKAGKKSKINIKAKDIYTLNEKGKTKYIFIENFMGYHISALREFRNMFNVFVNNLADVNNGNVIICGIACTPQSELIMRHYGFNKTSERSKLIDDIQLRYPFYETTWYELNKLLILRTGLLEMSIT